MEHLPHVDRFEVDELVVGEDLHAGAPVLVVTQVEAASLLQVLLGKLGVVSLELPLYVELFQLDEELDQVSKVVLVADESLGNLKMAPPVHDVRRARPTTSLWLHAVPRLTKICLQATDSVFLRLLKVSCCLLLWRLPGPGVTWLLPSRVARHRVGVVDVGHS